MKKTGYRILPLLALLIFSDQALADKGKDRKNMNDNQRYENVSERGYEKGNAYGARGDEYGKDHKHKEKHKHKHKKDDKYDRDDHSYDRERDDNRERYLRDRDEKDAKRIEERLKDRQKPQTRD